MLFDIYDKETEEHTILQIPGCELAQEEMKKHAEILCPHNCWRREEETIYLPNGTERGKRRNRCQYHLDRPPYCGDIDRLLEEHQKNDGEK